MTVSSHFQCYHQFSHCLAEDRTIQVWTRLGSPTAREYCRQRLADDELGRPKPKQMSTVRATDMDSRNSLIQVHAVNTNLKEIISTNVMKALFVLALGTFSDQAISSFFVMPGGNSFLSAFDTCYKAFYLLGIFRCSHWTMAFHLLFNFPENLYGQQSATCRPGMNWPNNDKS